ncbi:MAG TPA: LuxR C-terminal-related transcriptional regulator [Stellaceae bacterium]|nr:LuxR C-terminal-related transcriptional regulator [Stellaceae bacterium]
MNAPPEPGNAGPAPRVAVAASDPVRRLGLEAIVRAAGFEIAGLSAGADVVLADGDVGPRGSAPVLALGGAERGQAGLLPPDSPPAQIAAALHAVAAGLAVRAGQAPRPSFDMIGDTGSETGGEDEAPLLTPREIDVLAAIGNGSSNKAVARVLGISEHTVKFHVESLFRKLGAASRAEAVAKGLGRRLIEL